tara:strand:- start:57 stop:695 length:639 start_codon:yes stop_codon:yes gene_type:complete
MAKAKQGQTLSDKLNHIQVTLNAPKNLYNSFGKYKYRNLEGIFEGLKPLLKETGCAVTVSDEIVCVNEMNYIKATATLSNGSEESISVTGWARESVSKKGMDDSQITGATSSYARKYAMNGLFAIDDTVDADTEEYKKEDEAKATKKTVKAPNKAKQNKELTESQKVEIRELVKKVEKGYGEQVIASLIANKIHQGNFKDCVKTLKEKSKPK